MEENDTKKYRSMQESVKKGSFSGFHYAFCRLILDELLSLGVDNMFAYSEAQTEKSKKGGLGITSTLGLTSKADILLKKLAEQMNWKEDFKSPKDAKHFIDGVQAFLHIFEAPPPLET